jgi:hypothetical protein
MDHDAVIQLLDPSNITCQLILAHIVALHHTIRPISCRERKQYTVTMYSIRMSCWIPRIGYTMPSEFRHFMRWPLFIGNMHLAGLLEKYTVAGGKRKNQAELEFDTRDWRERSD